MNNFRLSEEKLNVEITDLGPQLHTVNIHRVVFLNNKNGQLFACCGVVGNPAKLAIIDIEKNTLIKLIPVKTKKYNITVIRGLKVYGNIIYICGTPGIILKYELGKDNVEFVSETIEHSQTFDMKIGNNGILIGGVYGSAKAFEFNLQNNNFLNYGSIIEGEEYVYSIAYDDKNERVYFGVSTKGVVVEFDRKTKSKKILPLPITIKKAKFVMDMEIVGDLLFIKYKPGGTYVYDLQKKKYLNDIGENIISRFVSQKAPKQNKVYYTYKDTVGFYDFELNKFTDTGVFCGGDAHGFTFKELNEEGFRNEIALIGITQQGNLFKYNTQTGYIKLYKTCIPGEPTKLNAIAIDDYNNIYVSGYLCGGIAKINAMTGEKKEFTNEVLGYGQQLPQCDRIIPDGQFIYFSTYPDCQLWRFDKTKKWDKLNGTPKIVYSAYEFGEQDRGVTSLLIKEKHLIAIGTVPKYSLYGGSLTLFNTEIQKGTTYYNLSKDQSITALEYIDGIIYIGTHIAGGHGSPPTQSSPKIIAFDINNKNVLWETKIEIGAYGITSLLSQPNSNFLWGTADGNIFCFDRMAKQISFMKKIVMDECFHEHKWRDGQLSLMSKDELIGIIYKTLFKLNFKTKKIELLFNGGKWLASCKESVYITHITNVVNVKFNEEKII